MCEKKTNWILGYLLIDLFCLIVSRSQLWIDSFNSHTLIKQGKKNKGLKLHSYFYTNFIPLNNDKIIKIFDLNKLQNFGISIYGHDKDEYECHAIDNMCIPHDREED